MHGHFTIEGFPDTIFSRTFEGILRALTWLAERMEKITKRISKRACDNSVAIEDLQKRAEEHSRAHNATNRRSCDNAASIERLEERVGYLLDLTDPREKEKEGDDLKLIYEAWDSPETGDHVPPPELAFRTGPILHRYYVACEREEGTNPDYRKDPIAFCEKVLGLYLTPAQRHGLKCYLRYGRIK
jgi:hypothetical protein